MHHFLITLRKKHLAPVFLHIRRELVQVYVQMGHRMGAYRLRPLPPFLDVAQHLGGIGLVHAEALLGYGQGPLEERVLNGVIYTLSERWQRVWLHNASPLPPTARPHGRP
ncbi:hypothetical protein D3C76_1579780 [compost metagenome]